MTNTELKTIQQRLGLGSVAFAEALGCDYMSGGFKRWLSGFTPVPPAVAQCARLLVWLHERSLLDQALMEIGGRDELV